MKKRVSELFLKIFFLALIPLIFASCGDGKTEEGMPFVKSDNVLASNQVSISPQIKFLFNKEMSQKDISTENFFLFDANGTRIDTAIEIDENNKKYVIATVDSRLEYNSNYSYLLKNLKDATGAKMDSEYRGSFRTVDFIKSISPQNGSSDISVFSDIVIEFGERIDPTTLSIEIEGLSFPTPQTSDNKTFTISPSEGSGYGGVNYDSFYNGLKTLTTFNITVSSATDIYANSLSSPRNYSFATMAPDVLAPFIASSAPSGGSTGIGAESDIVLYFNEKILEPSISDFEIIDDELNLKTFTILFNSLDNSVTINPTTTLDYGRTYSVVASGVSDVFGNILSSSSIYFTTNSMVSSFYPVQNANNVATNTQIEAVFKGGIDYSAASFTLELDGVLVDGNSSFGLAYASFLPAQNLEFSTFYTAKISGIKDLNGNLLPDSEWSFTTRSDNAAPVIVASSPSDFQESVLTTAAISAQFDEEILESVELTLFDSDGASVEGEITVSGATVEFVPLNALKSNENYTVVLSGVTDYYQNMSSPIRWTFATE